MTFPGILFAFWSGPLGVGAQVWGQGKQELRLMKFVNITSEWMFKVQNYSENKSHSFYVLPDKTCKHFLRPNINVKQSLFKCFYSHLIYIYSCFISPFCIGWFITSSVDKSNPEISGWAQFLSLIGCECSLLNKKKISDPHYPPPGP